VWTDAIIAAGAVGAIVAVDGAVEAAGYANLETGEELTAEHRTRVGSIDKVFMATIAVEVFADLDVSASRWLPELDEDITLGDLLSHRSGLFNWVLDGETYERLCFRDRALGPPEELLRIALRYPRRNVGEVVYSNTNYTALQLILERETGRPLGELVRERVIAPFGLTQTSFHEEVDLPDGVAHGYALKHGTFPVLRNGPRDVSEYWADGSIASDAADLASFFRRLDPGLLREYDDAVGHGGTMPGYTTLVLRTRDGSRVVVVATNSHSLPVSRAVRALARDLVLAENVVQ
jgi:D-alanyl-D-alanine carboxypeptidase